MNPLASISSVHSLRSLSSASDIGYIPAGLGSFASSLNIIDRSCSLDGGSFVATSSLKMSLKSWYSFGTSSSKVFSCSIFFLPIAIENVVFASALLISALTQNMSASSSVISGVCCSMNTSGACSKQFSAQYVLVNMNRLSCQLIVGLCVFNHGSPSTTGCLPVPITLRSSSSSWFAILILILTCLSTTPSCRPAMSLTGIEKGLG